MRVEILGSESLGVRGLSCLVDLGARKIVVDPGVALGYLRRGLHPHPLQAALSEATKARIVRALRGATDVVITHYHGDHVPLYDANPFQLPLEAAKAASRATLWSKPLHLTTPVERKRAERILEVFHGRAGEEGSDDYLELLGPHPHGLEGTPVLGVAVHSASKVFAHLSDTQLLSEEAVESIRDLDPCLAVTSGPPLYRYSGASRDSLARRAWRNLERLCSYADYVVVDHHLMRCVEGSKWLDEARKVIGERIMCAADYRGTPRLLLEAWRGLLYEVLPAPRTWFTDGYTGCGEALAALGDLVVALLRELPRGVTPDPEEVARLLREAMSVLGEHAVDLVSVSGGKRV